MDQALRRNILDAQPGLVISAAGLPTAFVDALVDDFLIWVCFN